MLHSKNGTMVAIVPKTKFLASLRNNSLSDVQAIADLVDNSLDLDVDASRIEITKQDDTLTIADNGSGMTFDVLVDAMKLGSSGKDDPADTDLGLFGIGLKNSSLAIGRRLTVITKAPADVHYTAVYDLDDILKLDEFIIPIGESSPKERARFNELTKNSRSGTVLIIERLDRITHKNDGSFANALTKHIGEVFRYFIADGKKIFINDKKVEPIEPLKAYYTKAETEINDQTFQFERPDGVTFSLRIRFGYLPSPLESETSRHGVNVENQGFYVLRNNRQIFRSTWFGLRSKHPQANRVRAEIFFNGEIDNIFRINFEKNHADLPQWFFDSLKQKAGSIISGLIERSTMESKTEKKNEDEDFDRIKTEIDAKANRIAPLSSKKREDSGKLVPIKKHPSDKTAIKTEEKSKDGTVKKHRNLVDFAFGHLGGSYICHFEDMGNGALRIRWNMDHVFHNFFSAQHIDTKSAFTKLLLALGRAIVNLSNDTEEYSRVMDDFQLKIGDEFRKLMD